MANVPLRMVVDDHAAHYWLQAGRLLEEAGGSRRPSPRRTRERLTLAKAVLAPSHPDALRASQDSVGGVGFSHAVRAVLEALEFEPIPPTPHVAHLLAAIALELQRSGSDAEALRVKLLAFAKERQSRCGYSFRWQR